MSYYQKICLVIALLCASFDIKPLTITSIVNKSDRDIYLDQVNRAKADQLEESIFQDLILHLTDYSTTKIGIEPNNNQTNIDSYTLSEENPIYVLTSRYLYKLCVEDNEVYANCLMAIESQFNQQKPKKKIGTLSQNECSLHIGKRERLSLIDNTAGNR